MEKSPFDATAIYYDTEFTHTQTGIYQRLQVWQQLGNIVLMGKKVLEMNCGTGEDAILFAEKKALVTATDISAEMLKVASEKAKNQLITFLKWDLNDAFPWVVEEKFDMAFSNFGGWNCLSEQAIKDLGKELSLLLNEKGQLCLVIMPSFCIWESIYFLLKGKPKMAFRRRHKKGVSARLNDAQSVLTYYYSPRKIENYLSAYFFVKKVYPIGFFLPPSYLDNFFKKIPLLLSMLYFLEKKAAWIPFFSYFSDHYCIMLEKK